jgi:hypothetical protein
MDRLLPIRDAVRAAGVAFALADVVVAGCSGGATVGAPGRTPAATATATPQSVPVAPAVGPVSMLSRPCAGGNAEVEQEADPSNHYLYAAWIACHGIQFARSTDGGRHFGAPVTLAVSGITDGPAIAVAPDGTVYVSFMVRDNGYWNPVVAASFDHGRTFPQVRPVTPPEPGDFGDREFIATGPHGTVYVTWDYVPRPATLKVAAGKSGSSYFLAGDLNAVIQKSSDHGRSWSPVSWVARAVPANGSDYARLLVQPDGRIDALYLGHPVSNDGRYRLGPGHIYFTSSANGGSSWSAPVEIDQGSGAVALNSWWIDGAIASDTAGNLYASWDTQSATGDVGWLAFSTDHGATWSPTMRVTPDAGHAMHLMAVAGGWPGVGYVSWLTDSSPRGYALYLRPFSIHGGWLSTPIRVSRDFGKAAVWPGDTTGISVLPLRGCLFWGFSVMRQGRGR